jgi:hypothetical protein
MVLKGQPCASVETAELPVGASNATLQKFGHGQRPERLTDRVKAAEINSFSSKTPLEKIREQRANTPANFVRIKGSSLSLASNLVSLLFENMWSQRVGLERPAADLDSAMSGLKIVGRKWLASIGALGSWRLALAIGVVLGLVLLGLIVFPSEGTNFEGNTSSPPSIVGLKLR